MDWRGRLAIGAHWRHLGNTTERYVRDVDAALSVTLFSPPVIQQVYTNGQCLWCYLINKEEYDDDMSRNAHRVKQILNNRA